MALDYDIAKRERECCQAQFDCYNGSTGRAVLLAVEYDLVGRVRSEYSRTALTQGTADLMSPIGS